MMRSLAFCRSVSLLKPGIQPLPVLGRSFSDEQPVLRTITNRRSFDFAPRSKDPHNPRPLRCRLRRAFCMASRRFPARANRRIGVPGVDPLPPLSRSRQATRRLKYPTKSELGTVHDLTLNPKGVSMSHVVSIQTQVRDPVAIRSSCSRLQLPEPTHGETKLFSSTATGWRVQPLPCQWAV